MNRRCLYNTSALRTACLLPCLFVAVNAETNTDADDAAIVQPFIGESTVLVIKVDPTRLTLPDLPDTLKSAVPDGEQAYARWAQDFTTGIETLRAATAGQPLYATIGIPLSKNEWPAFLLVEETSNSNRKPLVELFSTLHDMHSFSQDGITVLMPSREFDAKASLKHLLPSPREALSDAFVAVQEYPIQVLVLPPDYVRRTVAELMPQLPRQINGFRTKYLTSCFR